MTPDNVIALELERQSVVPIEATIPPEMTIERWRSERRPKARRDARNLLHFPVRRARQDLREAA